jgi:hypothetical protein
MLLLETSRGVILTAALCALIAVGCGEKEEPAGPSAAAAIAQGDEICAEARAEVEALRGEAPRTPEDAARLTEGVIATYEAEIADLEELAVPEELSAELDRYLAARERSLEPLRDGLEAARAGDAQAYADAQAEAAAGQVDRTRLARAVGFRECSLPGGAASPRGSAG